MKTLSVNCSTCGKDFQKPVYYIKQGQKRGYPNHFCSNNCNLLFNKKRHKELKQSRIDEYNKNPKLCLCCKTIIPYKDKSWKKYCSGKCSALYTQKNGGHKNWSKESRNKMSEWAKKYVHRTSKIKINKNCINCNKEFEILPSQNKKCCSKKCSDAWIKNTGYLKGKCGGYREKGGRGKQGRYKGYYCNSSWELAWIIYQLEHGITPERNKEGFSYTFDNKLRKYYPDFKIENEYFEIKGYHSKQVDAKIQQFPHKLTILHKNDLKEIFEYVEQKYGKDYINLYENVSG
jgi:predicted nucleic acid-binding Zn ribbon protein